MRYDHSTHHSNDWSTDSNGKIKASSDYLVSPVTGQARFILAQQLLAFVFNVQHRLDSADATIQLPDSSWIVASDLITQAINIWQTGTSAEQMEMASFLDQLNNSEGIPYIRYEPCSVIY